MIKRVQGAADLRRCTAMSTPETDRRTELREALNRGLILDAAEEAFAERGYDGAPLRDIAARAGFSSAAVYLFFENKQDLYERVLLRRGDGLFEAMIGAARTEDTPLTRLHRMADVAIAYYRQWPHFARLVAMAQATMHGSPLTMWKEHPDTEIRLAFQRAMDFEAQLVREGQQSGEIRGGDPHALAHLYSVLVNTYLTVGATEPSSGGLTTDEIHEILDSVLRRH
jgi:AcrR family transcriptional regulator